jgi:hypothetical protein
MKNTLIVGIFTLISLVTSTSSQATVLQTNQGLVSDTCVTKSGVFFVFSNLARPVGSLCSFKLNDDPTLYSGRFQ